MDDANLAILRGWHIVGWSLQRNTLFKLRFFDLRDPTKYKSDRRRAEAFFIKPSMIEFRQALAGPKGAIEILDVKQVSALNEQLAYVLDIEQGGAISVRCQEAALVLLA